MKLACIHGLTTKFQWQRKKKQTTLEYKYCDTRAKLERKCKENERSIGFWQSSVLFLFSCHSSDYTRTHTQTQTEKSHFSAEKWQKFMLWHLSETLKLAKRAKHMQKNRRPPLLPTICTLARSPPSLLRLGVFLFANQMKINTTFSVVLLCPTVFRLWVQLFSFRFFRMLCESYRLVIFGIWKPFIGLFELFKRRQCSNSCCVFTNIIPTTWKFVNVIRVEMAAGNGSAKGNRKLPLSENDCESFLFVAKFR